MKKLISKVCAGTLAFVLALSSITLPTQAEETGSINGTQKAVVVADDWGPAVNKTVIHLEKAIKAASIDDQDKVVVKETKKVINLTTWTVENQTVERTVLDVYASDARGNKVAADSEYITVEMYISPTTPGGGNGEGGAFLYDVFETGYNQWCDPYELAITLEGKFETTDGMEVTALNIPASIDLEGDGKICDVADQFESSTFTASDNRTLPYAYYTPANDNQKNALVIWLHGSGEGGTNPEIAYLGSEATALISQDFQDDFGGAYVLVPQCPTGYGWPVDKDGNYTDGTTPSVWRTSLFELIDNFVKNNEDIDADRIIIGGCSNGGNMVYDLVLSHMGYFAAAFPMCHEFNIEVASPEQLEYLKTFPVWSTYTLEDSSSFVGSIPIVEKMEEIGATNFHYSEFPYSSDTSGRFFGESEQNPQAFDKTGTSTTPLQYDGHWAWVLFFNDQCEQSGINAWDWLADQSLNPTWKEEGYVISENTDFADVPVEHQVTFTYKNFDAEKVELIGGFQFYSEEDIELVESEGGFPWGATEAESKDAYEFGEGMFPTGYEYPTGVNTAYEMEEIVDGYWQITLPLAAGEWFYAYNVYDGQLDARGNAAVKTFDPTNLPESNPNTELNAGWSVMYVGNSESEDVLEGQEYVFPNAEAAGTYEFVEYTASNGTTQHMGVYVPANYDENKTYKTLYLSHGGGGNETEWLTIGSAGNIMDNLIAAEEVEETIIVTLSHEQSFGWDFDVITENLMKAVVPYIEENYSVSKNACDRAFAGLSMGGFTTSAVYEKLAGEFAYLGIWSYCFTWDEENYEYYKRDVSIEDIPYNNYPTLMLGYGALDFGATTYPALMENLEEAGIEYNLHEVNGVHDWGVWRNLLTTFMKDYLWEETKLENPIKTYPDGVTVEKDDNSKSGYTAHFVYDAEADRANSGIPEEAVITGVSVQGSFRFNNDYTITPDTSEVRDYEPGYYVAAANVATFDLEVLYPMTYYHTTERYQVDTTAVSGAHYYSYVVTYTVDGEEFSVKVGDPANPSPCLDNKNSNTDLTNGDDGKRSIFYCAYDEKQGATPNLDFMIPQADTAKGTVEYVEYEGTLAKDQDLGVYLPAGYDPNRAEPYKVIYLSHGMGGNETYWFSQTPGDNVMDAIISENKNQEAILVGMDNALYNWDFEKIADNVINKIIPYMEANYNVSKDAEDRAFAGFSMGSMVTTYMAFHHADAFGYFGIFSGTNMNNVTFKEGFVFDQNKFDSDEEYRKEALNNVVFSEALLDSVVYTAAGNYDTAIMGNGWWNPYMSYEMIRDTMKQYMPEDQFVDGGLKPGSHDIYTWSQCLYEFAKDVCWSKEPVSNGGNNNGTDVSTGDNTQLGIWITLFAVSAGAFAVVFTKKRKDKDERI